MQGSMQAQIKVCKNYDALKSLQEMQQKYANESEVYTHKTHANVSRYRTRIRLYFLCKQHEHQPIGAIAYIARFLLTLH